MHDAFAMILLFAIGAIAGLRIGVPVLWTEWVAYRGLLGANGPVSDLFLGSASASAVILVILVELFEIALEKFGKPPRRLTLLSLLARVVSGAITAAILTEAAAFSSWLGAGLGAIGAVAGAYSSDRILNFFVTDMKVSRVIVSFVEDVAAIGLGLLTISYFV